MRKPTITYAECERLWDRIDLASGQRDRIELEKPHLREWVFTPDAEHTPLDRLRRYATLGNWAATTKASGSCESPPGLYGMLLDALPKKARSLAYVQYWSSMKSSIVVGRGWAGAKLHSDEFRNLWIDAITADIRMRRQLRGLVRAEIRWLYAEVPKLDRQTDNTGWLVIADWLQERDGEAVAVAIREVIAAVEQTA